MGEKKKEKGIMGKWENGKRGKGEKIEKGEKKKKREKERRKCNATKHPFLHQYQVQTKNYLN